MIEISVTTLFSDYFIVEKMDIWFFPPEVYIKVYINYNCVVAHR